MTSSPVTTRSLSPRPHIDGYDDVPGTSDSRCFGVTVAGSAVAAFARSTGAPAESMSTYDGDPDVVFDAEEPPVSQWALDAAAEHDRADLASAACAGSPLYREAALAGIRALELCDPVALAEAGHGRAVLDGIVAAQRTIARLQALQQRWIAAFARPDVAVPLGDVVDAAGTFIAEKFGAQLPEGADGDTDLCAAPADPMWGPTVVDTASRFASAEIACATHLAPITARVRLERAREMVDTLPATLAAQEAGLLDGYRAAIIADGVAALPAALRPQVERNVLASASHCTASELRRRVAHAVAAADPAGAAERAARAAESRHTSIAAIEDDMALFRAVLQAPDALTVHGVLDCVATSLKASGLADGRGNAQLRADVFADLFRTLAATGHARIAIPDTGTASGATIAAHSAANAAPPATGIAPCCDGGAPSGSRLSPRVSLTVHMDIETLAGLADRPGEIAGYGAVTAGTARALAASAESVRAMVEHTAAAPRTPGVDAGTRAHTASPALAGSHSDNAARSRSCGTVVDPGRAVYRPPEATADYVRARDRHCQFPGCRTRAERCDIDHRLPYQRGGATCPCNLDVLCRSHHRLKTFTSWRAVPDSSGRLIWTSPLGNVYTLAPEPRGFAAPRTFLARGEDAALRPFAAPGTLAEPRTFAATGESGAPSRFAPNSFTPSSSAAAPVSATPGAVDDSPPF